MAYPIKGPTERMATALGPSALLGTIVATTTTDNTTTAVPFNTTGDMLKGKLLELQPDTACYVEFGVATATATTSGIFLEAAEKYLVDMGQNGAVGCVAVSGTTKLRVREKFG